MKLYSLLVVLLFSLCSSGQSLTGTELLEKAIKYHDPMGNWSTFNDSMTVVMTTPKQSPRTSHIKINLPSEYFKATAIRDNKTTTYELSKSKCLMLADGELLNNDEAKIKKMSCERGEFMKNYYTYLYGLPMKLKDPGTTISETVEAKQFKGKDYLVLKASYDKDVGTDVWHFYFNPKTYALEVYQFFRTGEDGNAKLDTGEYILLSEEVIINGIKMPKIREWYYNKDDKYLGTDTLVDK